VTETDTAESPPGIGTFGGRTTAMAGSAVHTAANELRARILEGAERVLGRGPLCLRDSVLHGSNTSVPLAEVAPHLVEAGPFEVVGEFHQDTQTYAYGANAAVVDVDPELGVVEVRRFVCVADVGTVVNPMLVRGQLEGGAVQGIGGALLEELAFSPDAQPLSTSFADYLLPTSVEAPPVDVVLLDGTPSELNPLGVRGAGEIGITAAAAAVANAVADALGETARALTRLPLKPGYVASLLEAQ